MIANLVEGVVFIDDDLRVGVTLPTGRIHPEKRSGSHEIKNEAKIAKRKEEASLVDAGTGRFQD